MKGPFGLLLDRLDNANADSDPTHFLDGKSGRCNGASEFNPTNFSKGAKSRLQNTHVHLWHEDCQIEEGKGTTEQCG